VIKSEILNSVLIVAGLGIAVISTGITGVQTAAFAGPAELGSFAGFNAVGVAAGIVVLLIGLVLAAGNEK